MDDARTEFSQQRSRLEAANGDESENLDLPDPTSDAVGLGAGKTFGQWVQIGLALSLPLIIFGILALLIFFWMAAKVQ